MNTIPPMVPETFKDRRTGLVVFGILTILLGAVCALLVPLMAFAAFLPARPGAPAQSIHTVIPGMALYAALAIAFIWLGIGSILKRRWARALLLIGSWSWLVIGILALVFIGISAPDIWKNLQASMKDVPAAAQWVPLIIMGIMFSVIYVILPGVWVLFYRSRHVKATCDFYDGTVRWTDGCPLPVLGVVVWLDFSVLCSLIVVAAGPAVLPFFGIFLLGVSAKVLFVFMALVCAYVGWLIYRLDLRGWWILVAMVSLFTVSALVTYSRHDVMDMYRLMDFPPEQIAQMEQYNFLKGNTLYLSVLLWVVPAGAYLYYIRRFFPKSGPASLPQS